MSKSALCTVFALLVSIMLLAGPATAQLAPSLTNSAEEDSFSETLKNAAEAGVSVVVVDSNGNLISTAGAAEAADGAVASDSMEGASPLLRAQANVKEFRATLNERLNSLPQSIAEVAYILRATSPDGRIMTFVEVVLWHVVFFAVGWLFVRYVYGPKIAGRFVIPLIRENPQGYLEKMPFLLVRFIGGVVGSLVVIVICLILGFFLLPYPDDLTIQFTGTAILGTYFVARSASDLWRMLLSPYLDQYRIPKFSNAEAKRLYHWAWVLATFNVASIMFSTWINDFGLNYNVYALLYGSLSLISAVGNVLMILLNRASISNAILNGKPKREASYITRMVSLAWAPLLMAYFVFGWLELAFDLVLENPVGIPPIAAAYSAFLSIMVVYGGINYFIENYFARTRNMRQLNEDMAASEVLEAIEAGEPLPQDEPQRYVITTYEELARRVSGILAFVAGLYALTYIWGGQAAMMSMPLIETALDVMVILFIGYVIYHAFRIAIDSRIAEETTDNVEAELGDEGGAGTASRLATLLPLFRGAILAIVVIAIGLIALMEMGVNVSPLFAGAGVVGLAVGFGAQTLVRDIFSGAFFLIDDAFRKGEYIDLGSVKGTVEKISVRSMQLRHHLGALQTVPFGEIQVLTNYSRDWVIMKLPLRVTYDTDVEKVRKLIKNLGKDLLKDPVIGENFIQPLKSQGVIEMQDSAMIIRVKFMTKPGDQWLVRKKVYEEIRQLFEREGVKFAHREVTVRLADEQTDNLTHKQKEAVAGAVQAAVDEDLLDEMMDGGDDR